MDDTSPSIPRWNSRCHQFFPDDAIRSGDRICAVNGKQEAIDMMEQLRTPDGEELFIVLVRDVGQEDIERRWLFREAFY